MKKSTTATSAVALRYHLIGNDGLYNPIPFLLVSERMCQDILAERERILAALPASQHERQQKRFERYNPQHSSNAFNSVLKIINPGSK